MPWALCTLTSSFHSKQSVLFAFPGVDLAFLSVPFPPQPQRIRPLVDCRLLQDSLGQGPPPCFLTSQSARHSRSTPCVLWFRAPLLLSAFSSSTYTRGQVRVTNRPLSSGSFLAEGLCSHILQLIWNLKINHHPGETHHWGLKNFQMLYCFSLRPL